MLTALRRFACLILAAACVGSVDAQPAPPKRLYHGAAYYPELWPESEIDRDIAGMKRLGINVARIGEFAWSRMEPDEGKIDLSFFRRVMDKLHAAGIDVVLCTPTPTPPVWLTHGHPERLYVSITGETYLHGGRQHVSTDHPAMRAASARIVGAMARELGRHPALVAWQIDNEFKCHVSEDYSSAAIAGWHAWLKKRYGTVEKLNEAWGTEIWSQRYQSIDQVPVSRKPGFTHSPSLVTAYRLFSRDSIADFMEMQNAIIRKHSTAPITHNFSLGFNVNFERMTRDLDFASFDDYPQASEWQQIVFQSDAFRNARPGRPFWLMETSVAHNGWLANHQPAHPANFLRAEAIAAYALGAEAFNYWLWRQQRTGCELPHSGVLQAWGTPGIGYAEAEKVEAARRLLEPLLTTSVPAPARIGLTWSDRGRAMIQTEPLGARTDRPVIYNSVISDWHKRLVLLGYHRDIRFEGAPLDGLKVLITPAMPAVDDAFLAKVRAWVEAGGTWIIAPLTGTRTVEHTATTDTGLGKLDALAGVESVFGFPITATGATGEAFGKSAELGGWCMALRSSSPDTVIRGFIRGGVADGLGFIAERPLGRGRVVVLGAQPEGDAGEVLLNALVRHHASAAGVEALLSAQPGTLVVPRTTKEGRTLYVVLDFDDGGGEVTLPSAMTDAVTGQRVEAGVLRLDPYGYRVFIH